MKKNKSVAQVILRWLNQRGIVALAKSVHGDRIKQNFDIEDFSLSDEDMEKIASLDTKTSLFFNHQDPNIIEWFGTLIEQRRNQK